MFDKKKQLRPNEQKAKLTVLKDMHKMASDMMKDDMDGLKKVTVAADSEEGLQEGLEKAEEILESKSEMGEQSSEDEEMGEDELEDRSEMEDEQEESEPMDADEIEAKIQELMELKKKLLLNK